MISSQAAANRALRDWLIDQKKRGDPLALRMDEILRAIRARRPVRRVSEPVADLPEHLPAPQSPRVVPSQPEEEENVDPIEGVSQGSIEPIILKPMKDDQMTKLWWGSKKHTRGSLMILTRAKTYSDDRVYQFV